MGRPMLGMQASGECGDNMAGYAFTMFDPLLEHPYVYPTSKRYHALYDAYPQVYRDGKFMDVVGLAGIPDTVRKGIMLAEDRASAIIHLYNTSYNAITFTAAVDNAELGLPSGLKAYDAETGNEISLTVTLEGKEKKAILLK